MLLLDHEHFLTKFANVLNFSVVSFLGGWGGGGVAI